MSNKPDNWCVDVYRGLFVDRVNDDAVKIAPCCQAEQKIEPIEHFDFVNSVYLASLRHRFDQGEKPRECRRCWHDEDLGKTSRRINVSAGEVPSAVVGLENITVYSTWACNLACIMCSPEHSSTWAKELRLDSAALQSMGRKFNKSKDFLNKIDLTKIKRIHFNGGEPLLNTEHESILKKFADLDVLGSTKLIYNTNGTQYPTDTTLELWGQAQKVVLWLSIDGTQDSYEYVRYPAKWQATSENLIALKNAMPKNVDFGFNVTVGCYNVFEVIDVFDWAKQHFPAAGFSSQIAYNFDPAMLNAAAKKAAISHLQDHEDFQGLVNHLTATMDMEKSTWMQSLDTIDQRRGTNWKQSLKVSNYYS